MDISDKKQPSHPLDNRWKAYLFDAISYYYVLLFVHTAVGKLINYNAFFKVLGDLPAIGNSNGFLAPAIIGLEFLISVLLIIPKYKRAGLFASLVLMVLFTGYLGYMVLSHNKLPCSCGGAISGLSWGQHVAFNAGSMLLAIIGLLIHSKSKK